MVTIYKRMPGYGSVHLICVLDPKLEPHLLNTDDKFLAL